MAYVAQQFPSGALQEKVTDALREQSAAVSPRNSASRAQEATHNVLQRLRTARIRVRAVADRVEGISRAEECGQTKPASEPPGVFSLLVDHCEEMHEELAYIEAAVAVLETATS